MRIYEPWGRSQHAVELPSLLPQNTSSDRYQGTPSTLDIPAIPHITSKATCISPALSLSASQFMPRIPRTILGPPSPSSRMALLPGLAR
mmetsp:Transcript_20385/g.36480  ORF Transcript_20385/g.36480 Transcript_20385/m.36480 type:complete len:89 (-) Transcript_20385:533-799(-)